MVELRKRKAPAEPAPPPPAKKKSRAVKKAVSKVKAAVGKKAAPATNGESSISSAPTKQKPTKVVVGDTITLDGFGGEIETNDGEKTSLQALVESSQAGVVLFTYPKALTPGCTTQACLFRDNYTSLTATGLAIYGLSADSPKLNTSFKTKKNLPYSLLCDPSATLISAIGLKKVPKGTTRGVFVVDKSGKVLAAQSGSPAGTVAVVRELVESGKPEAAEPGEAADEAEEAAEKKEADGVPPAAGYDAPTPAADVADQVADTAAKLDEDVQV